MSGGKEIRLQSRNNTFVQDLRAKTLPKITDNTV